MPAELHAVFGAPGMDLLKIGLVKQLRQRLPVVVPDLGGFFPLVEQVRQLRQQVIAAAPPEILRKRLRPRQPGPAGRKGGKKSQKFGSSVKKPSTKSDRRCENAS